ncbi:hypothetical protein [Dactylosporangium sp. NPDC050588]|uniref:hypothetical protein n=1 Tax=Dactylosporangium sp. NPDC050588 TaxID=3157211 RepID=UPI0033DC721B
MILERLLRGEHSLIGITFVTRAGAEPAHDLTLEQATLLATQIADAVHEARRGQVSQV